MSHRHKIWIDLDNSPHVPLFAPIIRRLEAQGHAVVVTTRDCFQVCGLARLHGLTVTTIGRHYGANKVLKILGTLWRAAQLTSLILRERPAASLSHGSRPLAIVSALLGIRTMLLFDYEHAQMLPLLRPDIGMAPEALRGVGGAGRFRRGLRFYDGLKEDVYAAGFAPDPTLRQQLGLPPNGILVTIRPPATEAHYHAHDSQTLYVDTVHHLAKHPDVTMVLLPRNERTQRDFIEQTWPTLCAEGRIVVPTRVVDGMNLVWHSDLVISGGGTMNREAAALGVPVYSIFRGRPGALDRYLAESGRLTLIASSADLPRIKVEHRPRGPVSRGNDLVLAQIMRAVEELLPTPSTRNASATVSGVDAR